MEALNLLKFWCNAGRFLGNAGRCWRNAGSDDDCKKSDDVHNQPLKTGEETEDDDSFFDLDIAALECSEDSSEKKVKACFNFVDSPKDVSCSDDCKKSDDLRNQRLKTGEKIEDDDSFFDLDIAALECSEDSSEKKVKAGFNFVDSHVSCSDDCKKSDDLRNQPLKTGEETEDDDSFFDLDIAALECSKDSSEKKVKAGFNFVDSYVSCSDDCKKSDDLRNQPLKTGEETEDDDLLFELDIAALECSEYKDVSCNKKVFAVDTNVSKPQSPIALLKWAPKFRVFMLGLKKSKVVKTETNGNLMASPKQKEFQNGKSSENGWSKRFTVKCKAEEVQADNSLRNKLQRESLDEYLIQKASSKRFVKDEVPKLNLLKFWHNAGRCWRNAESDDDCKKSDDVHNQPLKTGEETEDDDSLFKLDIAALECSEDKDVSCNKKVFPVDTNVLKPQSPIALLKWAPKFRVFMLGLKKSKVEKMETNGDLTASPKQKEFQKGKSSENGRSKRFAVKCKAEEVQTDNSLRRKLQRESLDEFSIQKASSKRFVKDEVPKYLKLIKPLYERVSKRYVEKTRIADQFSTASSRKVSKEKPVNRAASLKVVFKHIWKSRSASSAVMTPLPINRRDDSSLLH